MILKAPSKPGDQKIVHVNFARHMFRDWGMQIFTSEELKRKGLNKHDLSPFYEGQFLDIN